MQPRTPSEGIKDFNLCALNFISLITTLRGVKVQKDHEAVLTQMKLRERASHFHRSIYLFLLLILWLSLFAGLLRNTLSVKNQVWGVTEWSINYEAGFVRRGLSGQLLLAISSKTGLSLVILSVIISVACFLVLLAFGIWAIRRGTLAAWALPSAILIGSNVYSSNLLRKDSLILVMLLIALLVMTLRVGRVAKLLLLDAVVIAAGLSHESFFIIALPPLCIIAWNMFFSVATRWERVALALLLLPVTLGVFAVITHRSPSLGNGAMWQTWFRGSASLGIGDVDPNLPRAAAEAISWSLSEALELTQSALSVTSLGLWTATAAVSVLLTLIALRGNGDGCVHQSGGWPHGLKLLVAIQFCLSLILCVLGWDFSRWLYLAAGSVTILWCFQRSSALRSGVPRMPLQTGHARRVILAGIALVFSTSIAGPWGLPEYLRGIPLLQIPLLATYIHG